MYVPMIASGELIDGYIGRIKVVSQFRDLQALKKTLVDGYRQSADYNHERKDEIRDLIEVMKSFTGKTRYELINEHTTLPAEYWNWRKIDWSTFLRKRNSATFPFLKHQPHVAKLCPKCVDIDKSVTGSSIWYCVHQVDGVTYCPKHRDAKLLRAKSATYVYKRLPEWYLRHRELDPHENYTILSKTHERKVQHYGELIASLMMRRDQISDAVLIRLIEHLKRQPLHQGLKRYISFEAACAPKSWFMSSKYPRRWLWKNFPDAGDTDFYLANLNQASNGRWTNLILVLASFTKSIEQVNLLIDEECRGPMIGEMLLKMHQTHN